MRRATRLVAWVLIGAAAGLVLALVAVLVLTRTDFGRERIRGFALGWLQEQVNGTVRVGRITGAGLLGGAMVHDFAIHGPDRRPFVVADSLRASYDLRSLLRGRIVLDDVTLWDPEVYIEMLPGDTLWNYERIFPDTTPDVDSGPNRLILLEDVQVVNGTAVVRRPWEPDSDTQPSDTARLILEEGPGGLAEVWRFEAVDAQLSRVLWESPIEEGRLFDAQSLSARAYIWKDPLHIEDVRGRLTAIDSVISFDLPEVRLPASRAAIVGQVILTEDNVYDVRIDGRELRFADLQWLYPDLPEEGGGTLVLRIQTQKPKGILWLAEDARITAPNTQMSGTLGIVTGDTLYFTRVDLRASPLDVDFLQRLLPTELPVEGLLIGTVEVRGPLSALETSGSVRMSGGSGDGSSVRWAGVLDARGGLGARRLTADLADFDMDLLSAFRPGLPLHGRVDGQLRASGRLDRALRIDGTVTHQAEGRPASVIGGSGTIRYTRGGGSEVALDLEALPLSLEELATFSPSLAGLVGEARGTVHLSGPADRLVATGELTTAGGPVAFDATIARSSARSYHGHARVDGFRLGELDARLPDAAITGDFGFALRGGPAGIGGALTADLESARVTGVTVRDIAFRGALDDGLLRVDTLTLRAPGASLTARGAFGLRPERTGTIEVQGGSSGLESLERSLFGEVADPMNPRLAGTATLAGTLSGNTSAWTVAGAAGLDRFRYQDNGFLGAMLNVEGGGGAEGLRLRLTAHADSILAMGRRADSATVAIVHDRGETAASASAWWHGETHLFAEARARGDSAGTHVEVSDLRFGVGDAAWSLADAARFRLAPSGTVLEGTELRRADGNGSVRAEGRLAWIGATVAEDLRARPLDFTLDLEDVPFRDALALLRENVDAGGVLDGTVRIGGSAGAPQIQGELAISELRYQDVRLDQLGGRVDYRDASIEARVHGFHAGRRVLLAEGTIPVDLRFGGAGERRLDRQLDVTVQADSLPAGLVMAVLDGFSNVSGLIDGSVTARGTTREPEFGGALTFRRGAATWDATGVRYQDVLGTALVEPGRRLSLDLSARAVAPDDRTAARGGARLAGALDLTRPSDPGLALTLYADELLAARRRDAELTVSGEVRIDGRYRAPVLSGDLRVDRGALYLDELYRQYLIVGLEDPLLLDVVDTSLVSVRRVLPPSQSPFLRNLVIENATVSVGAGSWLRSRQMNVEVAGNLNIDFNRQAEDLRLTGSLGVVRGTYRFDYPPFSRIFEVRDGTVEFPGTPGIDPNLNIRAAYRARAQGEPLDIVAVLTGTLQSPRVRLTSDAEPPISESDLASYLFFGAPTYAFNLTAAPGDPGAGDGRIGRIGQAAFNAYGFGYVATGLQTLAQSSGLVDYVGLTAAETSGPGEASGIGGLLAGTEIEFGRYLSPRTFIAWTQPLASQTRTAGFRLEWRFHPTYTAELFAEDRFARTPTFGLGQSAEFRKVYGFFLFREWGY